MPTVESPADHEVLRFFGEAAFEDWRLFEAHFELAAGSSLLVLLLPGTSGALICEQALAERLLKDNHRLERIHFSSASEIIRLGEKLLSLNPDGIGGVWVSFLSPDRTDDAWKAACGKMFTLLNLHRNRILKALPVPLVFVGEPWLQQIFREAAPDFWSVRSTVVRLLPQSEPDESRLEGASMQSQQALIGVEAASDPDYTLQQAHRLANRKDLAFQRTELLMRAAAGFHEKARLELAESCWREALNSLADASEIKQQPRPDAMHAGVLNNLAMVLSELGYRDEALAKAREAARIFEQLAKAQPEVFLPDVAMSLNNLANMLSDLGRREEALEKARESARIYEQLAKTQPEAFLPDVAMSLNNLATRLSELGQREEALLKAQEAVRIDEQLANARPDTFLPSFATALHNLASMLSALGRREEALDKAQEATRIYEKLAKARPDTFLASLAGSANNLANRLGDLGRREEALDKAQEAARIYQQLAKARPDAFLPNVAGSLNNLANRFSELGRPEEALDKAQEAARIYEQLAKEQPDAFLPNVAGSLSNLANRFSELGGREEALDKAQEAARIYEQLAKVQPDAFLPEVATSLNNLAIRLNALGRHGDALHKAQEAVRIREQLAKARPDVFLPNLAKSLTNLATSLSDLGRCEEAMDKAQEAVRIYEQLAMARPEAFLPDLATSYGVRGGVLHRMERHAQAAATFAQGIRAITPHFQKGPPGFAQLIGRLYQDYLRAIQQAQLQPDKELLAPVIEVFDKLEQNQPKK